MSSFPNLQKALKLGSLQLKNRVVLSSMTRNRAVGTVPNDVMEKYYVQRSGAGLLLTEGVLIVPQGSEWPSAPGIWNAEQVKAWHRITTKVHEQGSHMFAQLWHIGRVAHPLHQSGQPVPAPSKIGAKGGKFRLLEGSPGYISDPKPIDDPRVIIDQYRVAAQNAKEAGFDGVELHSANGYLPSQFIEAHSNQRTDEWGGSAQKRSRFVLEVIKTLIDVMGDSKRVGIKLSPAGGYNDMGDPIDVAKEEYTYLITELDKLDIGYIQLARYSEMLDFAKRGTVHDVVGTYGHLVKKPLLLVNGSYTAEEAEATVANGTASLVAFGLPFINNPDLPERFWNGWELNQAIDFATFYYPPQGSPLGVGYAEHPTYQEWKKAQKA